MRIVRFRDGKGAAYGLVEGDAVYRAVGSIFDKPRRGTLAGKLAELELLVPCEPPKIVSVGANYRDRCIENNLPIPDVPGRGDSFLVPLRSAVGPGGIIHAPDEPPMRIEYGAELAVVMKRRAKSVPVEKIRDYILGFTCVNNVWGKLPRQGDVRRLPQSFDGSCPLGPMIVTDIDPRDLAIRSLVNGEVRQNSRTSQMIFDAYAVIAYVSGYVTLEPGDVIQTGTPGGVAALKPGDVVTIEIEGIGSLSNTVKGGGRPAEDTPRIGR